MTERFAGRVALITGASRGMGRATALRLAREGADVVVNYRRNQQAAEEVAAEVRALGRRALLAPADMERPDEIRRMFAQVRESFGALDFLILNAAATAFRDTLDLKEHNVTRTFDTVVKALVICVQEAVPLMEGRGGRIVTVSSWGKDRCIPGYATLGAAKAAVETWTRYLAYELAPRGIVANCVNPGFIDTDSLAAYTRERAEEAKAAMIRITPRGRLGRPADVAAVIAFLCSEDADFICGQVIAVDGGLLLAGTPFEGLIEHPRPAGGSA